MNKLWIRLAIGFLLVTWAALILVAFIVRDSISSSFDTYVNQRDVQQFGEDFISELETYYANNGSWDGVGSLLPIQRGERRGRGGVQTFIANTDGMIIASTAPGWVDRMIDMVGMSRRVELHYEGNVVGYLGEQSPGTQSLNQAETDFMLDATEGMLIAAGIAGAVALTAGIGLSWTLTRPLRHLTGTVNQINSGELGQQITLHSTDEIEQLVEAFNSMSARLTEGEKLRQRMAADVAHELRTPVTVMRGHLEAMMDGVYPLDREHLAVAYDQTLHLARLVADLRLLTQAEAGRLPLNMGTISPADFVNQVMERFQPLAQDADIHLRQEVEAGLLPLKVDIDRYHQVFSNLLMNALRYTQTGGEIVIKATQTAFEVCNTGEIDAETAAHLFDRFWRADAARERDSGGSGLGLAISRQLIRLHGGDIQVISGDGWTRFRIMR